MVFIPCHEPIITMYAFGAGASVVTTMFARVGISGGHGTFRLSSGTVSAGNNNNVVEHFMCEI